MPFSPHITALEPFIQHKFLDAHKEGQLSLAMKQGYQESKCMNYLVDGFPRNEDNRTCWEVEMGSKTILKQVIVADCTDDDQTKVAGIVSNQ
ncbi:hypothetical protein X801_08219, partial [Opisthorchis viverrini]